jgi:hypothetical protein
MCIIQKKTFSDLSYLCFFFYKIDQFFKIKNNLRQLYKLIYLRTKECVLMIKKTKEDYFSNKLQHYIYIYIYILGSYIEDYQLLRK